MFMEKKSGLPIHVLSLRFDRTEVPVRILRRANQKHIRIRISADGQVTLSAPRHTPLKEVRQVLAAKEEWISTQLKELEGRIHRFDPLKGVFLDGEFHPVVYRKKKTRRYAVSFDQKGGAFIVAGPAWDRLKIEAVLAKKLQSEARERLERKARQLSGSTGIPFKRLFLRNQRTRWGSSSSIGNISLNWRMVMLPPLVQQYLLIHELAHQQQLNHSPAFWKLVEQHCPDFRDHEKVLKQSRVLMGLFRS